MARTDAIVLGAGIVGTSTALHLAKRGLSVALLDRRGAGEETSYGNAGIIEGNTVFPPSFPSGLSALARIALKQAPEANYHLSFLPHVAPWLLAYRAWSRPERQMETARLLRPIFSRAVAEHEDLMAEAGASRFLRKTGWLKIYRGDAAFAATARERAVAADFGLPIQALDGAQARALEPALQPVFDHALFWESAASISNPLGLTRAYAARFAALGGVVLTGDARSLHRNGSKWRVEAEEGPIDAPDVVVALGPWSPDLIAPLGIRLPMAVKRGYHLHYTATGNASLARPILDAEVGYCLAPMEQGIRLTTGAEFAARDAAPTPVQIDRVLPAARGLFPLGRSVEDKPWMGSRPCFADSRPVLGPAPGQAGLWLAFGHAHWGLTLGAITGRLMADMLTKATPVIDPAPFAAQRWIARAS
jgi:D-amino-acid dehydrogenase